MGEKKAHTAFPAKVMVQILKIIKQSPGKLWEIVNPRPQWELLLIIACKFGGIVV